MLSPDESEKLTFADCAVVPDRFGHSGEPDHTTRRTRKNAVFADKLVGGHKASR